MDLSSTKVKSEITEAEPEPEPETEPEEEPKPELNKAEENVKDPDTDTEKHGMKRGFEGDVSGTESKPNLADLKRRFQCNISDSFKMSPQRLETIEREIIRAQDFAIVNSSEIIPTFLDCRHENGKLILICANFRTTRWVESVVPQLDNLWYGNRLIVQTNMKYHTKYTRGTVSAIFLGLREPVDRILKRLQMCNPMVDFGIWNVFNSYFLKDGQRIVFGVDIDSYDYLVCMDFNLYYGLGLTKFRSIKAPREKLPFLPFLPKKGRDESKAPENDDVVVKDNELPVDKDITESVITSIKSENGDADNQ